MAKKLEFEQKRFELLKEEEEECEDFDSKIRLYCKSCKCDTRMDYDPHFHNFKLTHRIPVIFHNLKGYDSHFIIQQIGEIAKKHTYKNKNGEECQMNINVETIWKTIWLLCWVI